MKEPSESITSASIRKVMGIFSEESKLLDQILICRHVHIIRSHRTMRKICPLST